MTAEFVEKRGSTLKQKRKELGLTQQQVADQAGMDVRTYGDLERGRRPGGKPVDVRPDSLARICKVLCIDMRFLLPPPEDNSFPSGTHLTFAECRTDFLRWESANEHDTVQIDTLAIDLADGWENIVAAINACHANNIVFRILVVGAEITENGDGVPSIVTDKWVPAAANSLAHIRKELANFNSTKKNVSIQIKTYNHVPTVHGLRATKNGKTRWWLGECRLTKGELTTYEWGQDDFLVINGSKALQNPRVKTYNLRFTHYWATTDEYQIEFNSAQQVMTK